MLNWLLENAVVATGLALVVWSICRVLRPRPALRHALWLVVLLKLVTPPVVHWPWSIERAPIAVATVEAVGSIQAKNTATSAPTAKEPAPPPSASSAASRTATETAPPPSITSGALAPAAPFDWLTLLTRLWIVGAILRLALELARWRRLARDLRGARPAPAELLGEVAQCAAALGLATPPVRVVDGLAGPFVYGLTRAKLYWPADLDRESCPGLRGVVTHELAHLERRDHRVAWLELCAATLFWWWPVLPWVRQRLREAAEWACDARVVDVWPEARRDYAEALIEVAIARSSGTPLPALGMTHGGAREFEARVVRILEAPAAARIPAAGLAAVVLLGLAALPAWSSAPLADEEEAPPPFVPTPSPLDEPGLEEFRKAARAWANDLGAEREGRGFAVAVVRGRELLDLVTRGELDADTPHRVGTVTSVLTATRLAALRDAGRLRFDDPVLNHVGPARGDAPRIRASELTDPRLAQVTLRHLLMHTSGLPRELRLGSGEGELLEVLKGVRLVSAPGVDYAPSRAGYSLLGRVIERAGGEDFGTGLEKSVLRPLGMGASSLRAGPARAADGMSSTARDLARLVSFQLLASPVHGPLSPRTVTELQEPREIHQSWLQPRSIAWMQDWIEGVGLYHLRASRQGDASTYLAFSTMHKVGLVVIGRGVGDVSGAGRELILVAARTLSDTMEATEAFQLLRYDDALEHYQRLHERYPHDTLAAARLGFLCLATGLSEEALDPLLRAWETGRASNVVAYNLACASARVGEREAALDWLELALARGFRGESLLASDPDLASLRGDPRFEALAIQDY